jgi:tetratricopeptide (TPR) repeat protein
VKAFAKTVVVLLFLILFGREMLLRAEDQADVSPKITLRSLVKLEQQFRATSDPETRAKIGKQIIEIGEPLLHGSMDRSKARLVAVASKTGSPLPEELKGYFGFWMLRAIAALAADDKPSGRNAADVLQRLGAADSEKDPVIDVVAALNIKGWLDKKFDSVDFDCKWVTDYAVRERYHDLNDAFALTSELVNLKPLFWKVYFYRGVICYDANADGVLGTKANVEVAIRDFTTAANLLSVGAPENREEYADLRLADCYQGRAGCRMALGDYDGATADYIRAINAINASQSTLVEIHQCRGVAYLAKGAYDSAILDFTYAIKHVPNPSGDTYALRGTAYLCKGDYNRAIADYTAGTKRDYYSGESYIVLARLRASCASAKFRDGSAAVSMAQKGFYMLIWPYAENFSIAQQYAVRDQVSSRDVAEMILQSRPFAQDTLAAAYAATGDYEAAVKAQTIAIENLPKSSSELPEYEARLDLYKRRQPYRETGKDIVREYLSRKYGIQEGSSLDLAK